MTDIWNEIAQWVGVAVILASAVIWIVRRVRRRKCRRDDCCDTTPGCEGCGLAEACNNNHRRRVSHRGSRATDGPRRRRQR